MRSSRLHPLPDPHGPRRRAPREKAPPTIPAASTPIFHAWPGRSDATICPMVMSAASISEGARIRPPASPRGRDLRPPTHEHAGEFRAAQRGGGRRHRLDVPVVSRFEQSFGADSLLDERQKRKTFRVRHRRRDLVPRRRVARPGQRPLLGTAAPRDALREIVAPTRSRPPRNSAIRASTAPRRVREQVVRPTVEGHPSLRKRSSSARKSLRSESPCRRR